jgi:hypothetical protein
MIFRIRRHGAPPWLDPNSLPTINDEHSSRQSLAPLVVHRVTAGIEKWTLRLERPCFALGLVTIDCSWDIPVASVDPYHLDAIKRHFLLIDGDIERDPRGPGLLPSRVEWHPAPDSVIRRIISLMARFDSLLARIKFPVPTRREFPS